MSDMVLAGGTVVTAEASFRATVAFDAPRSDSTPANSRRRLWSTSSGARLCAPAHSASCVRSARYARRVFGAALRATSHRSQVSRAATHLG